VITQAEAAPRRAAPNRGRLSHYENKGTAADRLIGGSAEVSDNIQVHEWP